MGLKWEDIGIDFQFEFPTEEEVNKVLETYEAHQSRVSEIRRAYGVNEDRANEIALGIESGDVFYPSIGSEYEPHSVYFASRYEIVKKLERRLSDKETLACAKAGLLSFMSDLEYKDRKFKYCRYVKINSLVREAYYAYYREVGYERLEKERQKLIECYKILLGFLDNQIRDSGIEVDVVSPEAEKFVQSLVSKHKTNRGISVEGGGYGILSFEYSYFYTEVSNLDNSEISVHKLTCMRTLIDELIGSLEKMNTETYRIYKFQTMGLTKEEQKEYDENIEKYQKSIK